MATRPLNKRLGLRLSAESRSQLFMGAAVGRHVQRVCERHACLWDERRSDRSQLKEKYRRAEKSGLSGGRRDLPRRDQRVLEVARDHHGRDEADSNHRLPLALRGICRERRFVHQFRALAALEEYGLANSRRCPAGPGDRGPNFLEDPRAIQEGRWEVPRSDLEPDLELQRPIEPAPGRGIEGSKRQGPGGSGGSSDEAANQGRPAASRLRLVERRWYNVLRQLDLLRLIHRSGQSNGAARSLGSFAKASLVERERAKMGRQ